MQGYLNFLEFFGLTVQEPLARAAGDVARHPLTQFRLVVQGGHPHEDGLELVQRPGREWVIACAEAQQAGDGQAYKGVR